LVARGDDGVERLDEEVRVESAERRGQCDASLGAIGSNVGHQAVFAAHPQDQMKRSLIDEVPIASQLEVQPPNADRVRCLREELPTGTCHRDDIEDSSRSRCVERRAQLSRAASDVGSEFRRHFDRRKRVRTIIVRSAYPPPWMDSSTRLGPGQGRAARIAASGKKRLFAVAAVPSRGAPGFAPW